MLRPLLRRILYLLRRHRLDMELAEEMALHRAMKEQELETQGLQPGEARLAANRSLGNTTLAREDARAIWTWRSLDVFRQDLTYAIRQMRREAGVTLVILAVLALGIGATTTTFSAVESVLIKPLPFRDPERLVNIREIDTRTGLDRGPVSSSNFLDWRDHVPAFEAVAGWRFEYFNVAGRDEPEQVQGYRVSADYLPTLGAPMAAGRFFAPDEEQRGRERVVILSDALWRRRFGSSLDLVGQTIRMNGEPFTVVGILASSFPASRILNRPIDLFVPLTREAMHVGNRRSHNLNVYGRLGHDTTLEQAQAQLDALYRALEQAYPHSNAALGARILSLPAASRRGSRPVLILLMGAVAAVLFVACTNIAGLLVARASRREREMIVRVALGAGRGRLLRQVLTESMLLALLGGAAGSALAIWGTSLMNRWLPFWVVGRLHPFAIDTNVFGFAIVISLVCGLLFGLTPAMRAGQSSLTDALGGAGRATVGRRAPRPVGRLLVASELALTLVLSTAALLLLRSALFLQNAPRGVDFQHVLTMQIWLPDSKYPEGHQVAQFFHEVVDRVAKVPGVDSASLINFTPLAPQSSAVSFDVDNREGRDPTDRTRSARCSVIDAHYFHTMRIPVVAGRTFTDLDTDETRGVAIVSASLARALWPDSSAVGRQLRPHFPRQRDFWIPFSQNLPLIVIGVVGDVREEGPNLGDRDSNVIYLPYGQNPASLMHLVVRTRSNPAGSVNAIRQAIWSVDRDQPVFDVKTMEDLVAETFGGPRIIAGLTGTLAGAALVLASLGVFGLFSYLVTQRTPEIGLRMALGAERRHIVRAILGEGGRLGLVGLAVGVVMALGATRLVSSFLYGVQATDPFTLIQVAGLVLAVTLCACLVPTYRALRVDPITALRND
jgi:putative ABC transport system permease protein